MPWPDTHAMAERLKLISTEVAPGTHAILIVDQAGGHTPPPESPELNPVENLWQYIRDNGLSNRVFASCDDIVSASR
ncbi:MAG: transposase [Rhodospirillales bacterium]|nr:transposase [Rhodospirillales bacterium]